MFPVTALSRSQTWNASRRIAPLPGAVKLWPSDAYDTAVVQNTKFENIRIEAADSSIIELASDDPPSWRTAANTSVIKDTYFTNVASDVRKPIEMNGRSATVNITGVHFSGITVQGNPVTSRTDTDVTWTVNSFVSGLTFSTAP